MNELTVLCKFLPRRNFIVTRVCVILFPPMLFLSTRIESSCDLEIKSYMLLNLNDQQ